MSDYEKDGFIILSGLEHVFKPILEKLEWLLAQQFQNVPSYADFESFSTFLINVYDQDKERLMSVYHVLDRSLEMLRASVHPEIICNLTSLRINPIISNYPTWRLDVVNNCKDRWFPWHVEKYHNRFSDTGVTLWAPLHKVGPNTKANSLYVKPGSHLLRNIKYGEHKFDITDQRVNKYESLPVFLEFGQCLVFSNNLLHRSGIIQDNNGIRLSLQFRYDDLNDHSYGQSGWPSNFQLIDAIDEDKYGKDISLP